MLQCNRPQDCSGGGLQSCDAQCKEVVEHIYGLCDGFMQETESLETVRQVIADAAAVCANPPPPPASGSSCGSCSTFVDFQDCVSMVDAECCNQPEGDCSNGTPSSCNTECAQVLVPMVSSCAPLLSSSSGMGDALTQLRTAAAHCPGGGGMAHAGIVVATTPASGAGVTQTIEAPYSPLDFTFATLVGATYEVAVRDLDTFDSIVMILDCDGVTTLTENDDAVDGSPFDDGSTYSWLIWSPSTNCLPAGAPMSNGATSRGTYSIRVEDGYETEGFFTLSVTMTRAGH